MSKPNHSQGEDDHAEVKVDDAPPSYTEATSSSVPSTHLSDRLASLPSLLLDRRTACEAHGTASDTALVSLMVSEINALLSSLAAPGADSGSFSSKHERHADSRPTPQRQPHLSPSAAPLTLTSSLILVPSAAVPPCWHLTTDEPDSEGLTTRVAKIANASDMECGKNDRSDNGNANGAAAPTREFDDWGRWDADADTQAKVQGEWWFRDEDMARRLARHLQQAAETPGKYEEELQKNTERREVPSSHPGSRPSRLGGLKRLGDPKAQAANRESEFAGSQREDGASSSMTVTAEEVTFRRENEMGLWESLSGWAVVVRVKIRQSRA